MNTEWKYVEATEPDPDMGSLGQLLAVEKPYWYLELGQHTVYVYLEKSGQYSAGYGTSLFDTLEDAKKEALARGLKLILDARARYDEMASHVVSMLENM